MLMSNSYPIAVDGKALIVTADEKILRIVPSPGLEGTHGATEFGLIQHSTILKIASACGRRVCSPEVMFDTVDSHNGRAVIRGGRAVCRDDGCPLGPKDGGANDRLPDGPVPKPSSDAIDMLDDQHLVR